MKMIILFSFIVCLLVGCTAFTGSHDVKEFIPGTYISSWRTEFNASTDTLLIEPLVEHGSESYLITKRTFVIYFNGDKERDPTYKITRWTGLYVPESKTLFVNNNGKVFSFDPVKKVMKVGPTIYKKL